ncbi:nitrilase-related carbon-nitrogen hydrolase [Gordonia hydrophobica]|uniref:Nitrilase-related carbon-nitrogen hydrolase n=1 Tax=Gordonia hydrophobica TaxID=40516 RepID=A0ABZ2U000_9ACTN|nr:nitrilase-related carbon-nitrogen hydrolase [Gordonia hydrophobica]MBM7369406.1 nitrilase [Gordonia hydrophobica]
MRIAMFQGPAAPDVVTAADEVALAATNAAKAGAQILVCSELTCTGYRETAVTEPRPGGAAPGPIAASMAAAARSASIAIAYGYVERVDAAGDRPRLHNAVAVVGPDGHVLAHYRKTHLYRPPHDAVAAPDDHRFTPGDDLVVQFPLGGLTCGVLICYDVEFPEAVRAHAVAGTDWLLVPTALARPDDHVATMLVPARAMESGLFVTYVNRTGEEPGRAGGPPIAYCGLSCTVAPDGVELVRAAAAPELLVTDLDPARLAAARERTPYLRDRRTDLYGPALDRRRDTESR